ncbi:hypothetical protein [Holospora obtusa]|nr:hypothetical protein [Holospora obtusa]
MSVPCFATLPDITLPPLASSPAPAFEVGKSPSIEASENPEKKTKLVDPPMPKNLIEKYYATAFADYFGPSPWVFSSTP